MYYWVRFYLRFKHFATKVGNHNVCKYLLSRQAANAKLIQKWVSETSRILTLLFWWILLYRCCVVGFPAEPYQCLCLIYFFPFTFSLLQGLWAWHSLARHMTVFNKNLTISATGLEKGQTKSIISTAFLVLGYKTTHIIVSVQNVLCH